jgi:hypothetical protein
LFVLRVEPLEIGEVTPREIRAWAHARCGWRADEGLTTLSDLQITAISKLCEVQRHTVLRALSRRDKRTPKSDAPATEAVTIRLNAAQKRKAQRLAKKSGKTVSGWAKALVEKELAK